MTANNTPRKANWSQAYPYTHEAYEQQARDYVDQQHAFFAKQKEPGHIPDGFEGWVMAHLPKNDPTVLRMKWKMINGSAPFPGDVTP